jgi:hypothetical protein
MMPTEWEALPMAFAFAEICRGVAMFARKSNGIICHLSPIK